MRYLSHFRESLSLPLFTGLKPSLFTLPCKSFTLTLSKTAWVRLGLYLTSVIHSSVIMIYPLLKVRPRFTGRIKFQRVYRYLLPYFPAKAFRRATRSSRVRELWRSYSFWSMLVILINWTKFYVLERALVLTQQSYWK